MGRVIYFYKRNKMTGAERRTSERAEVKFKVNYIHKGDYLISFSRDVSVDGMFLSTENPAPIGEYPRLTFSVGELMEVSVLSKVVWVNPPGATSGPGMAVQFLEMPPELKETILKVVKRVSFLESDGNA